MGGEARKISVLPVAAAAGTATIVSLIASRRLRLWSRFIQFWDPLQPASCHNEEVLVDTHHAKGSIIQIDRIEQLIADDPNSTINGAEQKIVWHQGSNNKRTKVCVVFLHGWSACRQEVAPVPQRIAAALQANLYLGRLPGHGRRHERGLLGGGGPSGETLVTEATPRELFLYAIEAIRIGQSLGEKVVLIGMSTGACLATWLAAKLAREQKSEVLAGLVLLSPAYALAHPLYPGLKAVFATLRLFPSILRRTLIEIVVGGKMRNIKAHNAQHARYTTLQYPTVALLNLLDVLWEVETYLVSSNSGEAQQQLLDVPTIMIGNPQDPAINFRTVATNHFLRFWCDVPKVLYCMSSSRFADEHHHVLGSQIVSPSTVDEVSQAAIGFLLANVGSSTDQQSMIGQQSTIKRAQSMSSGMGQYASSFSSLSDLTRPLLA